MSMIDEKQNKYMCTVEPMDWAKDWAKDWALFHMMALALTGGQGFSGWDAETQAGCHLTFVYFFSFLDFYKK